MQIESLETVVVICLTKFYFKNLNNSRSILCAREGSQPYVAPWTLEKLIERKKIFFKKLALLADSFTVKCPVGSASPRSSMSSVGLFLPRDDTLSGDGLGVRVIEAAWDALLLLLLLTLACREEGRVRTGEGDIDAERLLGGDDFLLVSRPLSLLNPSTDLSPFIWADKEPSSRKGAFIAREAAETTSLFSERETSLAASRILLQTRFASFFSPSSA